MVTKKDVNGRPMTFQVDKHFTVEFNRQDAMDIVLVYCYQGDEPCEMNTRGLCSHALKALDEAAWETEATITSFKYEENAKQFAGWVDARIYTLRSAQTPNGEGQRWVVAKNWKVA